MFITEETEAQSQLALARWLEGGGTRPTRALDLLLFNPFHRAMASHVPFLALRPDQQFSPDVNTRDQMDPAQEEILPTPPAPSRLPGWVRLPLLVVSSLSISAFAYSALSDITGLELAAVSRDLTQEWQVAAVVAWKLVSLLVTFSSGYDCK